jgi:FAD-dependent oxidoreductase family protein
MTKRFTPVEIAVQRSIKEAFDPAGLLNPGIVLPEQSPDEPDAGAFGAAVRAALTGGVLPEPGAPLTAGDNTDITVNLGNLSLVVGADVTLEALTGYLEERGVTCAAVPTTGGRRARAVASAADLIRPDAELKARICIVPRVGVAPPQRHQPVGPARRTSTGADVIDGQVDDVGAAHGVQVLIAAQPGIEVG